MVGLGIMSLAQVLEMSKGRNKMQDTPQVYLEQLFTSGHKQRFDNN